METEEFIEMAAAKMLTQTGTVRVLEAGIRQGYIENREHINTVAEHYENEGSYGIALEFSSRLGEEREQKTLDLDLESSTCLEGARAHFMTREETEAELDSILSGFIKEKEDKKNELLQRMETEEIDLNRLGEENSEALTSIYIERKDFDSAIECASRYDIAEAFYLATTFGKIGKAKQLLNQMDAKDNHRALISLAEGNLGEAYKLFTSAYEKREEFDIKPFAQVAMDIGEIEVGEKLFGTVISGLEEIGQFRSAASYEECRNNPARAEMYQLIADTLGLK